MKEYVNVLRQYPEFQLLIDEIKQEKPVIPVYNHDPDNTEEWKANSNILKGYSMVLMYLGDKDE